MQKKKELIKQIKFDDCINFTSSGYAARLFSIFSNKIDFCFKENKTTKYILLEKKQIEKIEEMRPFIFVNNTKIHKKKYF